VHARRLAGQRRRALSVVISDQSLDGHREGTFDGPEMPLRSRPWTLPNGGSWTISTFLPPTTQLRGARAPTNPYVPVDMSGCASTQRACRDPRTFEDHEAMAYGDVGPPFA
jgi:hypothetical protein